MANLLETADQTGSFSTFLKAVNQSDLASTLNGEGPLTLLIPTDDAFAKLPEGTLEALLNDETKLKRVLMYHVVFGDVRSQDLAEIDEAPTAEGSVIAVDRSNGITVNATRVLETDLLADNGVIHSIDGVLMPAIVAGH
ncbi:fasciclin domain-containing protein [Myxacorys almedinensis]|uniref:Fasciclin domain-containing protein n=1 Tax=Myxacorys almedinensis A TaxID=2690445 RepID=A0A8J7Z5D9_9CYAN|nr:fasciclin domain-containing protein [Myxacorys almedinensis]NDJ16738.1 fasciclin domain-containing protein [Myxacorys almedinensis A]